MKTKTKGVHSFILSCYNYTSYTAVSELSTHSVNVTFYNPQILSKMSLKFAKIVECKVNKFNSYNSKVQN